jgi:hypothetical protein
VLPDGERGQQHRHGGRGAEHSYRSLDHVGGKWSISILLAALTEWAERHRADIAAARTAYDRQQNDPAA